MKAPSNVDGAGRHLGRFRLKRVLGRGAQATVWLAHDPRLDRDVAVKLLDPDADTVAVSQWLHEARAVSRLTHPNIVPVFEADEHDGQPYLVFELVEGATLAELRRKRGALGAREAVQIMLGVLDALAAAHAQGIVHRDLKPSNVLLGSDGRPRVMDFGIAARVAGGADGRVVGTPGYMSPEAARGEAPVPAMDVFAAGLVLAELICGQPLLKERDPYVAIRRVQREQFALPADAAADAPLHAIVRRALAMQAGERYDSALAMHAALKEWLQPQDAPAPAATGKGALDFLLRRMRHKSDFPALSESVSRIHKVATSDLETLSGLSSEILKDVALTNKLLRVVNTAHFSHAGGGSISTVSRAVALVGFAGIRNMALSLVLLDHMQDKAHAAQLKEEFLRALAAGTLASELMPVARDTEEAFIASMFQNLGRLLTEYYFPEEAAQIRSLLSDTANPDPARRSRVAEQVLGIGFEDLGLGVARSWGLPEALQRCMRVPDGEAPARALERGPEQMRWLGRAANEAIDAILQCETDQASQRVREVAEKYARSLGLEPKHFVQGAAKARERVTELARAMNLQFAASSPAKRLLVTEAAAPPKDPDSLAVLELHPTLPVIDLPIDDQPTLVLGQPAQRIAETLAAGIQDITNTMVEENFRLNEVLRMVLETMYRALGFQRVVLCLRDPKLETLTGRLGLGLDADRLSRVFRVPLRPAGGKEIDLFAAVCMKGVDTLISDATAANIASRLPEWYRQSVAAQTFLLLPMRLRNAPFGMIYADNKRVGSIRLEDKELSLVCTLRNQAVMAFRHFDRG